MHPERRRRPIEATWAVAPRVADVTAEDAKRVELRVEPRLGSGPPCAVVLVGPWTAAALGPVRAAASLEDAPWPAVVRDGERDAAPATVDAGAAPRHPGPAPSALVIRVARAASDPEGGWSVRRPSPDDAAVGDHAVLQLCSAGGDAVAPGDAALVRAVLLAIREALEGWTPPLVRLRPWVEPDASAPLELFAFSCQYPPGLVEGPVAYGSMHRLARALDAPSEPGFVRGAVSMGDLVYVDATAGLFEPKSMSERFDGPWERLRESAEWRSMRTAAGSGFVALADDHEFDDNWEPDADDTTRAIVRGRGIAAFARHLHAAAPTVGAGGGPVVRFPGGASVFLADTRIDRERRRLESVLEASILHEPTRGDPSRAAHGWTALRDWLNARRRDDPWRPKFVFCPALLLPRRLSSTVDAPASALRSDAWDGFPGSMHRLFRMLVEDDLRNVVVVSGDEHFSMSVRATLTGAGRSLSVFSVHCSAMHAPYPFANGRVEDFAADGDAFVLPCGAADDHPEAARCEVDAVRVARLREGFARLRERRAGDAWTVEIDWFDGRGYRDGEARYLEDDAPADAGRGARLAVLRRRHDDREVLCLDRPAGTPPAHPCRDTGRTD
ncbi:MAG: alkaline phosphatase D family protein [Burkholderiales bacterium]|jgi:hypothetical protein